MYVSPSKKRLYTIASILVLALIPISVLGFMFYEDWRTGAKPEEKPNDVRMSDITETSAVVSWVTDSNSEGWMRYSEGQGVSDGSPLAQDDRDVRSGSTEKRTTHYVTISSLQPGTTYYFVLGSGAQTYKDPDGNEFSLTTASVEPENVPTPKPVYGTVTNGTNEGAIVYITLSKDGVKSFPVSTLTNDSGNFEVDLAHIRTAVLDEAFLYKDDTEMIIFAQGGNIGGVLRTSVGNSDAISITMDENYSTTDIFADSSRIDVGDEDKPQDYIPQDQEEKPEEEEPEELEDGPTTKHDVPLTKLILGTGLPQTGIDSLTITNVTENSFTIVWRSGSQETGSVNYGMTEDDLSGEAYDTRDSIVEQGEFYVHHVTMNNLVPETVYYYEAHSGSVTYNDGGLPYQITLPATEDSPPGFDSVFGEVTGTAKNDAVLIARILGEAGDSSYVSSEVETDGTWTLSIGGIRTSDYSDYFTYTSDDTLEITVRTHGNEITREFVLGDVSDEIISLHLDMVEDEEEGIFSYGLFDYLSSLPETAINRLTAIGLTVSVLLMGFGTYLLVSVYSSEKNSRWEKEVLKDLE